VTANAGVIFFLQRSAAARDIRAIFTVRECQCEFCILSSAESISRIHQRRLPDGCISHRGCRAPASLVRCENAVFIRAVSPTSPARHKGESTPAHSPTTRRRGKRERERERERKREFSLSIIAQDRADDDSEKNQTSIDDSVTDDELKLANLTWRTCVPDLSVSPLLPASPSFPELKSPMIPQRKFGDRRAWVLVIYRAIAR